MGEVESHSEVRTFPWNHPTEHDDYIQCTFRGDRALIPVMYGTMNGGRMQYINYTETELPEEVIEQLKAVYWRVRKLQGPLGLVGYVFEQPAPLGRKSP